MRTPVFRVRGITGVVVATIAPYLVACHGVQNGPAADPGLATEPRSDHRNAEYSIGGQTVRLVAGVAEAPAAPGSAAKIVTRYFGNEVRGDFNADGREDVLFLLVQETGGSGTFFYAVAALDSWRGYIGSQGVLLGDRIAPQSTELERTASWS